LQQGIVRISDVEAALRMRVNLRRRQLMRCLLNEASEGVQSNAELQFRKECAKRGFPPPRLQNRHSIGSRHRYTDAEFTSTTGRLVMVEIDGVGHMEIGGWHADIVRHNDLAAQTGAVVLRVSAQQLRDEPDRFFDRLGQALNF